MKFRFLRLPVALAALLLMPFLLPTVRREVAAAGIFIRDLTRPMEAHLPVAALVGTPAAPSIPAGGLPPVFSLAGAVKHPGDFPLRPGLTLEQALQQGGGLMEASSGKTVRLFLNGRELSGPSRNNETAPDLTLPIHDGDEIVVAPVP